MARTVAELPKGSRITDYISLGVLNTMIPRTALVDAALEASSRQSIRQRDLPAHVMVYYVIALALYMQSSYREVLRCLLEGLQWLSDPSAHPRVVGRSGISQARTRLGAEPLQALHDAVVRPVGRSSQPGCGYRRWHLVSIDGSGLDVADEQDNAEAFGRPGAVAGQAPSHRSGLSRWSRTGLMFCLAAAWRAVRWANSAWPGTWFRPCRQACCAWRTATFSATRCGIRPARPGRICCGASRRICACRGRRRWPTAPI